MINIERKLVGITSVSTSPPPPPPARTSSKTRPVDRFPSPPPPVPNRRETLTENEPQRYSTTSFKDSLKDERLI